MLSLAQRMAIFTQSSREYPKTSRQSLVGLRPTRDCRSVFGYSLSLFVNILPSASLNSTYCPNTCSNLISAAILSACLNGHTPCLKLRCTWMKFARKRILVVTYNSKNPSGNFLQNHQNDDIFGDSSHQIESTLEIALCNLCMPCHAPSA